MRTHALIGTLCFIISTAGSVHAEDKSGPKIIVSCGESNGHTYYHKGGIVSQEQAGWNTDRVKDGYFFVQQIGEEYDLMYRDPIGFQSSTSDGAIVIPTHRSDHSLTLVVVYPDNGNTEVYNFQHIGTKNSEASWTSTKTTNLISKSGVFYAKCQEKVSQ